MPEKFRSEFFYIISMSQTQIQRQEFPQTHNNKHLYATQQIKHLIKLYLKLQENVWKACLELRTKIVIVKNGKCRNAEHMSSNKLAKHICSY